MKGSNFTKIVLYHGLLEIFRHFRSSYSIKYLNSCCCNLRSMWKPRWRHLIIRRNSFSSFSRSFPSAKEGKICFLQLFLVFWPVRFGLLFSENNRNKQKNERFEKMQNPVKRKGIRNVWQVNSPKWWNLCLPQNYDLLNKR